MAQAIVRIDECGSGISVSVELERAFGEYPDERCKAKLIADIMGMWGQTLTPYVGRRPCGT